ATRGADAAWYREHGIDFAVVDAQSPLRTEDVVFRAPSPSYLPAFTEVATWSQDTFPLVDPSLVIVRDPR
ncbi:MAG TPA: hypothetical protein VEZ44_16060, partial [bacterium]|nr:hypothetical protein [bacterium]